MTIKEIAAITNHIISTDTILDTPTFDCYQGLGGGINITSYSGTGKTLDLLLETFKQHDYSVYY